MSDRPIPTPHGSTTRLAVEPRRGAGRSPVVVEAAGRTSLDEWIDARRDDLEAHLCESGAVLFRGFRVTAVSPFQAIARKLCGDIVTENPEHTPVSRDGAVQTPVPYAQDRLLLWHNENSFNDEWPLRIAFCCVRPAETGGETPLADSCAVLNAIDPATRRKFVERGVAYVRNFGAGVGLDWRTVFRTGDRDAVMRYCREHDIAAEWTSDGRLRTTAVRPAVVAHPRTGELSWFNQAQHWHPACLDADVRSALAASVGDAGLPRDCTFGDGSAIADEEMQHVLDAYRRHQLTFAWQSGDVLVLDNVLWAHGRNPYTGARTMLVALGSLHRYSRTETAAPSAAI